VRTRAATPRRGGFTTTASKRAPPAASRGTSCSAGAAATATRAARSCSRARAPRPRRRARTTSTGVTSAPPAASASPSAPLPAKRRARAGLEFPERAFDLAWIAAACARCACANARRDERPRRVERIVAVQRRAAQPRGAAPRAGANARRAATPRSRAATEARRAALARGVERALRRRRRPQHERQQHAGAIRVAHLAKIDGSQAPAAVALGAQHRSSAARRRGEQASQRGDRGGEDRREHATARQIEHFVAAAAKPMRGPARPRALRGFGTRRCRRRARLCAQRGEGRIPRPARAPRARPWLRAVRRAAVDQRAAGAERA
jgi:hypothetical protein